MKEGKEVSSPYIDDCPVSIECKVKQIIPLGTHDLFIAEVVSSHVNEDLMDEKGKIHFEWADLITYCHGEYFPMTKNAIGSFGYSVMKEKTKARKAEEKIKETTKKIKSSVKKSSDKNKGNGTFKTKSKKKKTFRKAVSENK